MAARCWTALRTAGEFAEVRAHGERGSTCPLTTWVSHRPGPSRAGMSVPHRPFGHVARNTVRRRIRAALDELLPCEGVDVVIALRGAGVPSYDHIRGALSTVLGQGTSGGRAEATG